MRVGIYAITTTRDIGRAENPGCQYCLVGIICPLVEIGLTDVPKSGVAMAPPAPTGTTGLHHQTCSNEDHT